jgi:hypothetical protein
MEAARQEIQHSVDLHSLVRKLKSLSFDLFCNNFISYKRTCREFDAAIHSYDAIMQEPWQALCDHTELLCDDDILWYREESEWWRNIATNRKITTEKTKTMRKRCEHCSRHSFSDQRKTIRNLLMNDSVKKRVLIQTAILVGIDGTLSLTTQHYCDC